MDWANHVWAEVWLGNGVYGNSEKGRRVHLYPCKAEVDNLLLYESWGKNQMYIIEFHDLLYSSFGNKATCSFASLTNSIVEIMPSILGVSWPSARSFPRLMEHKKEIGANHCFHPVEDMTHQYTSDEVHVIEERRGISEEPVTEAITKVSRHMVQLLLSILQR